MSIHGICYDEGQSGRCGIHCRGFDECDIRDEIIEQIDYTEEDKEDLIELLTDEEMFGIIELREFLANEYIGEFRRAVLKAQTKYEYDEEEYLRKLIFGE